MTGFIFFVLTLVVLTSFSLAAPAVILDNVSDTSWLTRTGFSGVDVDNTIIGSLLLIPPQTMLSLSFPSSAPYAAPYATPYLSASGILPSSSVVATKTATEVFTHIITVTQLSITTITVSPALPTITDVITVLPSTAAVTTWAAPAQMTDLSAFNISAFAGGQQNLEIVNGIPADASATVVAATAESTGSDVLGSSPPWDNSTSVLRLLYPANSINPGNNPQGGAQFYATPLQINDAQNISLEYSVFFPVNFDWVLAGKLPGMYGGHRGCSGGDDALTCFSTRLMWRRSGAGELYLYAPKDKQTATLCADPQSVCDTAYGFSIGRGSFNFTPGAWTHVRQTVALNTPGEQDGEFILQVDGKQVIHRSDVFYRDIPLPPDTDDDEQTDSLSAANVPNTPPHEAIPGASGSLPLLTDIETESTRSAASAESPQTTIILADDPVITNNSTVDAVGFTGLFFSTFFGGHEEQYATPVDQYTWFKDFAIVLNS